MVNVALQGHTLAVSALCLLALRHELYNIDPFTLARLKRVSHALSLSAPVLIQPPAYVEIVNRVSHIINNHMIRIPANGVRVYHIIVNNLFEVALFNLVQETPTIKVGWVGWCMSVWP